MPNVQERTSIFDFTDSISLINGLSLDPYLQIPIPFI